MLISSSCNVMSVTFFCLAEKVDVPVKSELSVTAKPCTFEEQINGVRFRNYDHSVHSLALSKVYCLIYDVSTHLFAALQTGTSSLNSTLMAPMISIVKREEVTPMEISTNSTTTNIFKVNCKLLLQLTLIIKSGILSLKYLNFCILSSLQRSLILISRF